MAKIKSDDHRNLPLEKWNVRTYFAYLTHLTAEKFGVEYAPTGGGSKAQRWQRESGMLKQAQGKYGNAVLKRFIEICVEEYAPKSEFPYASFTFMYSYMDRNFAKAQAEVAKEAEKAKRKNPDAEEEPTNDLTDLNEWL